MSARVLQATMLLRQSRYLEAEALLREAIAEGRQPAEVHAMLALCLWNSGLQEAANLEIKSALAIDPNCAYAHYVLSFLTVPTGQNQATILFDSPIKHVLRALELAPEEVPYLVRLAELRQSRHEWKQSLETIEAALRLVPDHVGLAVLRAEALIHLGKQDDARETLLRALARDPEASSAHAGMGWALLRAGDYRRATEFFEEALRLHPELDWAQHGALECAKHKYQVYRLLAYPGQKLVHRPFSRFVVETGGIMLVVSVAFALLTWLDPVIRPRWGGGAVVAIFVPLLVLPFALLFGKEPFFSWLVRHHRAAKLSATEPIVKEHTNKWVMGIGVATVTLLFAVLLSNWKSAVVFALLGLLPGLAALGVTLYDTPVGNARKWLMAFSLAVLVIGPILLIVSREFILDLDPDPRSAVLLGVPAIFVAIVSNRVKQREKVQRHQQGLAATRKKMLLK